MKLTKEDFKEKTKNGVVVLDFWAPWCGPCKMLSPTIHELEKEMSDVFFGEINVDDEGELAKEYSVMSIPSVFILKDGKVADQFVGALSKASIKEKIKAVL